MARVDWSYYEKFEGLTDKYMPVRGEGETKASQIVTAVNKLIYKWYNDGDVFDNTADLGGWCNDLSSYANWLDKYTEAGSILERKFEIRTSGSYMAEENGDYENLLKDLADLLLDEEYLEKEDKESKVGSIYECEGRFEFVEVEEDEEDEDWYDEDEEDYEDEEE